jgi:hypothetical protein
MITHDPKKSLEDLRDHLARHDRPLAFLFGAGTSSAVNIAPPAAKGKKRGYEPLIPAIVRLTEICESEIKKEGKEFTEAWDAICKECSTGTPNIEYCLSKVRSKIDAIGPTDKLLGLKKDDLQRFEEKIRKTIAKIALPAADKIPESLPHDDFALWIKQATRNTPIEIFTTNYDILIERSLEKMRIPVFDGFVGSNEPFFIPDCLERKELLPSAAWVRLWKIHGSVNWKLVKDGNGHRVVRTVPTESGEMILPSHRKYDESQKQPYVALLNRLGKVLEAEDSLLITSGFSFGDDHINSIIFTVLENRPRSHVISLQFSTLSKTDALVQRALQRRNLVILGPNGGVIRGIWAEWKLAEPVDQGTAPFIDVAFDSKAEPENGTMNLEGVMRLGDFNYFCRALQTMTAKKT